MKKTKDFCLWLMCCLLFLGLFCGTETFAAVQEGKPGETLSGEYAVIINTDTVNSGETGTLQFDGTSAQAADSASEDHAIVQEESNASLQTADVEQSMILDNKADQAAVQNDQSLATAVQSTSVTYQVGGDPDPERSVSTGNERSGGIWV